MTEAKIFEILETECIKEENYKDFVSLTAYAYGRFNDDVSYCTVYSAIRALMAKYDLPWEDIII